VTALVFLPERLLVGPGAARGERPAPPGERPAPPDAAPTEAAAPDRDGAETGQPAMTRLPARRYLTHVPGTKAPEGAVPSLPKRSPSANLAPDLAAAQPQLGGPAGEGQAGRSPDEVRSMLTRYRSGVERGRADARDLPDPGDAPHP
jgi:hypothetical protein